MNNLEGTVSHAGSTRQRLLDQSARILAKGGRDALKVCAVAEQIAVPVDEAKSFFQDDHDLYIQTSTRSSSDVFADSRAASSLSVP